jgi:hypothetical protein
MNIAIIASLVMMMGAAGIVFAQAPEITEAAIAAGGSSMTTGNAELVGTLGQPVAGPAIGASNVSITSGLWNFTSLAPTAAPVSISGRVLTPIGDGLTNAIIYLLQQDGTILVARSSSLGYYRFDGIEAGQSVIVSVQSKRYSYSPRFVLVADEITGVDFIPDK